MDDDCANIGDKMQSVIKEHFKELMDWGKMLKEGPSTGILLAHQELEELMGRMVVNDI